MTTIQARRYAMTRISAGDYLLPSNDAKTLWRIYRYTEDGSAETMDGTRIVGEFWGTAKYLRPLDRFDPDSIDTWEDWAHFDCLLPTRAAAIDAAMRTGAVREP